MELKTRIFEPSYNRYPNPTELAHAMGVSHSLIYRVLRGKRPIGRAFIIGAKKAFPEYEVGDLFYYAPEECDG